MKGVTADVILNGAGFHDQDDDAESPSKIVAKEAAELEKLQKRLSIGDVTMEFESGESAAKAAAAKLAESEKSPSPAKETKRRLSGGHQFSPSHGCSHNHSHGHSPDSKMSRSPGDGPPMLRSSIRRTGGNIRECEKHKVQDIMVMDRSALTKKLRVLLSELAGRVAGRNKEDVTEALAIVEAMELQWIQKENELAQEKAEVRKMAALFNQASDDSKRIMKEARAKAQAEVEAAQAAVLRVEAALEEQTQFLSIAEKEELEAMRKEINDARRIRMLHEPSKTMDMEFEIEGLRQGLSQKAGEVVQLRKELLAAKRAGQTGHYEIQGEERLGGALVITQTNETSVDVSKCVIQWHRIAVDGSKGGPITGATRPQYAPEPLDVGWLLRADLTMPDGKKESVFTTGSLDAAPGLGNYVEALFKKGSTEFNVRLVQQNGEVLEKPLLLMMHIDRIRIKLQKGRKKIAKEEYTSMVQLCGARGGGQAASRALYWVANKSVSLMLVLESERERNAAILLARRFARDQNVTLFGPEDGISVSKISASPS
ncbi:stomatal closure-related actin-binding protein 1 [Physcomitrium patens]|uniref:Stomatal closure-related actin-binding protein 1 n=1 Tax=Physcomitrium patens TaxID=3218 RepID=A0A2K1KG39_PHYPA|nr:stomatal closure-related actin-binding protein 1-like [Physcomitrium patens]XP_024378923.1 stomatal closure-related actin-binding protein 1-like [Physcomitrium patens]XP_024378924.1 stomatal closure-related actin-binding protein 1-like [Physcomitrium patens]XP_024378926.1 stomatal closure-related actin-binding protein 1-like [Physcomitrium patens]XP_024378927.1 stomatal closure-related actin-binding protein 1-like [Physcomitrium patens]XP_024378928.1 stomatal closure-related actin-binding p|eukprot:XP_024378922.1 stomatal closure-related actin-binding protein 1-like [Physcomitrella patens]